MRSVLAATLAALLSVSAGSWVYAADITKRTAPHDETCAVPLRTGFSEAEEWAWNDRICMGLGADMREVRDERDDGEKCRPTEIKKDGRSVPAHRELRPEFLELILSHEPWASAVRHPEVIIECALVQGDIYLDNHEIASEFWFFDGMIDGKVSLLGTRFNRSFGLHGSTVTGTLKADRLEVGGGLFLREGGTFADIDLIEASIGGSVQLSGSTFKGEVDLTGATIGGELHLSSESWKYSPEWQSDASLVLRNTTVDALQARADDWKVTGGLERLPTDLRGLTFNRLGGMDEEGGTGMGDESADWLVGWIEAQRDHGDIYDPQPYTQLADVLENAGATDKADAIRYAKFEYKREHDRPMSDFRHALLTMEWIFLGYGVYPFQLLYWFVGLVALGGLIAQRSRDPSVRRWMGLWYSLENALPLIETNERFRDVEHGRPWLAHLFHLQKVLGFAIATVLVGALALLSG